MLDATDLRKLRHTRVAEPGAIAAAAARRVRRPLLEAVGSRLMLLAADHPARGSLGVRDDPNAMADRGELLNRLVVALARPGVDGVLATADIVEDLLLLGALDGKIVLGSMNRGGLAGSVAELDDRFTAYDAAAIAAAGLDGGKMLLRIDLGDRDTVATLQACGRAVTELAAHRRVAMIEPFMARRENGRLLNDLSPPEVVRACAIAAGLGTTSAYTWLKLPVVDDMERVLAGTTLPVMLLGGDPGGEPEETFAAWEKALALEGVYGLVVGRTLLYPPDGDVAAAVDTATALVKAGQSA
ncbi:MAG: aldolase [Catenulisporales bacterium]|jgi:DhnA family fructose-bisphosphate aldolase class Ia|nr:aldolase [Catenulisporales bacterium]